MTDVALSPESWQATPAATADLARHYAAVEAFQAERVRLQIRSRRLAWVVTGAMSVVAIAGAVSVATLIPLQRQVPIPIIFHDDGSTEVAWSWRDVMPDKRSAVVTAALWYYVRSREGYNWADARENYEAVGAMSAPNVRDVYQKWFLPSNPESPQLKVGRHGQVNIRYDGSELSREETEARIYYWKTTQMDGGQPVKTHWTARLQYQVNEPVAAFSRVFNPEGIIVTSYVALEDSPK